MYNGACVIMSHNNKGMIVRGIIESDIPSKETVSNEAANKIISVSNDRASIMDEIIRRPDSCVLLDMFMEDSDAVSFMREAKLKLGKRCPEFVVICDFASFRIERELYNAGAIAIVYHDTPPKNIWIMLSARTESVRNQAHCNDNTVNQWELEVMVTDIIHRIGVTAHIKGYQYLRCAIVKAVLRPDIINAVTKELYPDVAQCFCTTPSRVERAIRHAIEVAWDRGDIDFLCSYFGCTIHNSRGKPTNSEFIAMISDKLRMTIRVAS